MQSYISLETIKTLTEDELDLLFYVVNVKFPITLITSKENEEFTINESRLQWINKEYIRQMFEALHKMNAFNDDGILIATSLKEKLKL